MFSLFKMTIVNANKSIVICNYGKNSVQITFSIGVSVFMLCFGGLERIIQHTDGCFVARSFPFGFSGSGADLARTVVTFPFYGSRGMLAYHCVSASRAKAGSSLLTFLQGD